MTETKLKCTTRHVRLFTARVEGQNLVHDAHNLTMDLDPDNEFIWTEELINKVQQHFQDIIASEEGLELTEYKLRQIGSKLEGTIRKLLQAGELKYNPECRVLNYSMGLPRKPELL